MIIRTWLATGNSGDGRCLPNSCVDFDHGDGIQSSSSLSLLQVEATAWKPTLAKSSLSQSRSWSRSSNRQNELVERGQGGVHLEEDARTRQAVKQTNMFPKMDSTPLGVWDFFVHLRDNATAIKMKAAGVTGPQFLNMTMRDLLRYGVNYDLCVEIVARLETYHAQEGIRQEMMRRASSTKPFEGNWTLHDIVGPKGVLMISLDRASNRFEKSARALKQIGIHPVRVLAVDSETASAEELAEGAPVMADEYRQSCSAHGSSGYGVSMPSEQAIAASHRRALLQVKNRTLQGAEWTAIFEDDAVPALVDDWNEAFQKVWKQLPERVKIVRLGWCQLGPMNSPFRTNRIAYGNAGDVVLVDMELCCAQSVYEPGGCTTAYMVHRDIVDEMLNLFPCCSPLDSCYKWDLFKKHSYLSGQERGKEVMMGIDSLGQPLWDEGIEHHGMIIQDRFAMPSTQDLQILHR